MTFQLHHRLIEPSSARKTAFVLHGVLGSGQNFTRFIQRLARERPEYRYYLLDLRHHGQSGGAPPPNTLAACAADLKAFGQAVGHVPEVVIGHSFGGKVSIEYARQCEAARLGGAEEQGSTELEQVWVLDAVPGSQGATDTNEITRVVSAVRSVPMPAASRRDVVQHLTEQSGLSSGLAEWMATNLKREGEVYTWVFNLDAIEELMRDYYRVDLWSYLEQPRQRPEFQLVVAERSDRWTPELREKGRMLPSSARVIYHSLPNAGHWVHVDNPDGLLALMREGLPR
jgi:pimeloyl-ACP methyl ester carboxylesterase